MASPSGGSPTPVNPEKTAAAPTSAPAVDAQAAPATPPAEKKAKPRSEYTVEDILFAEPFNFDFFQAVRIMEKLDPNRKAIGRAGPPNAEVVRLRSHLSLSFPPSSIFDLSKSRLQPVPVMTVSFMGLYGPSGMLPRHYTELLMRIDKEGRGPEKNSLRDWLDVFNHRFISLFYRAWEKYRFYIPYERGDYALSEPDAFTHSLFSMLGLGMAPVRNRLRVATWDAEQNREQPLANVDDLVLLYYGGFLSHQPRNAVSLEAMLADYFSLAVQIIQFQGQWLALEPDNQSRFGNGLCNNQLGLNVVAGERVWDTQSKFRIRLGPLPLDRFTEFLPDRAQAPQRKAFFLLTHLVNLYVGPEFDFEVQIVLQKEEVPEVQLKDGGLGPRLGWNTWMRSLPYGQDAEEAVFEGEEVVWLDNGPPPRPDF